MNLSFKRTLGISFSIFALLLGFGLTGCDIAGEAEQEGVELEEQEQEQPKTEE